MPSATEAERAALSHAAAKGELATLASPFAEQAFEQEEENRADDSCPDELEARRLREGRERRLAEHTMQENVNGRVEQCRAR